VSFWVAGRASAETAWGCRRVSLGACKACKPARTTFFCFARKGTLNGRALGFLFLQNLPMSL
jgi:hypothetical protein